MAQAGVGIVTRTRDRPLFLARALASVLGQRHADWQLVIVNDGGDPAAVHATLVAAAGAASDRRIRVIDTADRRGRAAAFNLGLAALDTRFLCCLDDDDTWHPDFLAELVAFHAANAPLVADLGGVAAQVTALREEVAAGPDGRRTIVPLGEDGLPNAFRRTDFLLGPLAYATYRHDLYPVQWMLERSLAAQLGGFPEAFEVMEDRAFLLRFLQHRRIALLDRRLAFHHRRVQRVADTGQTAEMNTLDNPSYDWRRFSDLALPPMTSPAEAPEAPLAGLIRAAAAAVVRELNDETSALWLKVNGEAEGLRAALRTLEARLGAPPAGDAVAEGAAVWSLWSAVGAGEIGYALGIGVPFLGRLSLSHAGSAEGLLFHAAPARREAILQVPQTGGWCALELDLAGLAPAGGAVWLDLVAGVAGGGLIQTGIVQTRAQGGGFEMLAPHVHAAPGGGVVRLRRHLAAELLNPARRPRLSIVLPRQASNLRLHLHELAVSPA